MFVGVFTFGVTSVCCTAKQPPKFAALIQRTVHTFPVEAEVCVSYFHAHISMDIERRKVN